MPHRAPDCGQHSEAGDADAGVAGGPGDGGAGQRHQPGGEDPAGAVAGEAYAWLDDAGVVICGPDGQTCAGIRMIAETASERPCPRTR